MSKYIMDAVESDMFIFFLNWLVDHKGYEDAKFIIDVVEKPYKYEDLYDEFYKQWSKEVDNGVA